MSRKRINVTETFLPPIQEYESIIEQLWHSKWLTNRGDLIQQLENDINSFLDSNKKPLLVNNGTVAIQIPIKAMELEGEIITTPFSYIATTSTIVWENCQPVFVDIDPEHLTIDESKIEDAITDKTSAILAVHVYGNPCNVEKLQEIAEKHNLKLIYDAAHCFGVKYKGESLFNYGDVSTCSFHATKLFHTGEGGAIFCNRADLEDRIYYHHNFGHDGPEKFHGLGINAKMSELNAGMGIAILKYIPQIIEQRKEISEWYDAELEWEKLRKPTFRTGTTPNYSYYPVIFQSESDLLNCKQLLEEKNIFPRRYFFPSLNTIPYIHGKDMTISEEISKKILCLPIFAGLEKENVNLISNIINTSLC